MKMKHNHSPKLRFVLVNLVPRVINHEAALYDLSELKSLVDTFGGATIVHVIQRRSSPDPHTYIGSGKAQEVADIVVRDAIDVVVLNDIVKPNQLFNIQKLFWDIKPNTQVWDKVDLILHIFSKHARTAEAKLQIELAGMRHMGPRIYGLGGTVLSRQGGGIGTRGLGETNIELMKRHWRNEMKKVQEKLTKLEADRARKMQHRTEKGFRTISIIGYTNAGKTTLFNRLTKKNKLAEDILFATLDSSIGKIYLPQLKSEVLVTDTIGFIQNLPPQLIQAFKSTLLESIHADLLLHVIDASDPTLHMKIEVVEKVLKDLGIKDKKQLYVFNKMDVIPNLDEENLRQVYEFYQPQFISAEKNSNIDALLFTIEKQLQHL